MNRKIGKYSSLFTLVAVLGFAASMIFGSTYYSYLSSLFIAFGFIPMICAFASLSPQETKAASFTAIGFSAVYVVLIGLVYFAQLTTVHLSQLSEQATAILDFSYLGSLFFNYDLLGYAFMALATFFIGLTITPENKKHKWLKGLLLVHGVFAISCVLMPLLGVFSADMAGGDLMGTLVLLFWCAYFAPVCALACDFFMSANRD